MLIRQTTVFDKVLCLKCKTKRITVFYSTDMPPSLLKPGKKQFTYSVEFSFIYIVNSFQSQKRVSKPIVVSTSNVG